jgi:hypothetical protein
MTKKIRNVIFIILAVLFLIIAPVIVVYSLGWRFDWETRKIIQPGMFYFKAWPKNSQVYINNELKKKTDIFFGSALIENLLPETYDVRVEKEGYYPWQKNLDIMKGEVTEAKNITLIPKEPDLKIISANTDKFFFSPNKDLIITQESNPAGGETGWSLKKITISNNVKSQIASQEDFKIGALNLSGKSEGIELADLSFSDDSKRALITLGAKEKLYYFIIDLSTGNITPLDFGKIIPERVFFHTQDQTKVLILANSELKEFDITKKEAGDAIIKGIVSLYISNQDIYYLNNEGFVLKTSGPDQNQERINIMPFDIKQETEYDLQVLNNNIFLKGNSALYMLNEGKTSFEKLIDSEAEVKISSDAQKISYFNGHEIYVMFLQKKYEQPTKEAGDKVFINRFSEDINNLFWYNDHYLIFNVGDKIKVTEIDDRDKINIVDLAEYKDPEIFFAGKKLYLLSENNLYVSSELTP